ncbi:MAG: selenide, water dikinase SelD [Celeribacter sp.]|jgi:selenide,water dikinase
MQTGPERDFPATRDLLLVGGGHTHALVLRRWAMAPQPGVRVTLVNPGPVAAYSGMLPGWVAGHYPRAALDIDLMALAQAAGARMIRGRADMCDPVARRLRLNDGRLLRFDVVSFDIGVTSDLPGLRGFARFGAPAKPLGAFADRWERFLRSDTDGDAGNRSGDVAVLGGGVAGVELALAMARRLHAENRQGQVRVIEANTALKGVSDAGTDHLRRAAQDLGVEIIEGARAVEVTATHLRLETGREIPAALTVGAAGAQAQDWLSGTGLTLENGYIAVDPALRAPGFAHVFAAGDCAHMIQTPRPKAGVFAVRQAPVLFANLRATLAERPQDMRRYRPQKHYLKLISMGDRAAVADRRWPVLAGGWVWQWKDRIDRRFMAMLSDLPQMPTPRAPIGAAAGLAERLTDVPLCGGCGAKVGPGALKEALRHVPAVTRSDIIQLPGDDAAMLRGADGTRQIISTDHLRAVTSDAAEMARITICHALGDVWAMGAAPQSALASVILPEMAEPMQADMLAEITQAAAAILSAEGAALVGGHSSVGSELVLGFTVTGTLDREPVTLAGGQPGDALILTRPIGSGALLAGAMRGQGAGRTRGPQLAALLDLLATPYGAAAAELRDAHAMTDVTGFGLAGHLANICRASGLGAELSLPALPLHDGAEAVAEAGIRSSIWPANRAALDGIVAAGQGARYDLLFDPQTAGGLLAAVPEVGLEARFDRLRRAGVAPVRIGRLVEGAPRITFV